MKSLPLLLACLAATAEAAEYRGLPIENVLQTLRDGGLPILYSSDLVKPWMRVEREPRAIEPRAMLTEILAPHGITIAEGPEGTLMLVREVRRAPRFADPGTRDSPAPAPIDTVIVSASHYQIGDEPAIGATVLSSSRLESLPDIGEDPIRAVARLPGVAQQDFSSQAHLRGGTVEETLVRFDDLRLYNPYHLKDFLSVFSTIDPGIVSNIRVYTGGFPVAFGDRSSGVVDIAPRLPGSKFQGQAVASMLTAGAAVEGVFADGAGDWAAAARRGNMDLYFDLADSPLGEPAYHDLYGHVGRRLNDWFAISANALVFDDRIAAFDSDHEEEAVADYRDQYFWLRTDLGAPDGLGGRVLASHTVIESERTGSAALPGVGSGELADERSFSIDTLQADGWRRLGAHTLLQAGAEWKHQSGIYNYSDNVNFEMLFLTAGAIDEPTRTRSIRLRPSGDQSGAYVNWRIEPAANFAADLGLRWDRDTLAERDSPQWSPRAVLMWRPTEDTRIRLGWGRYRQSQGINELQVPDGETVYQPSQLATHRVASIEHSLTPSLMLRAEFYRKDYDRPFARYENLLDTVVVLPELKPDRILVAPDAALAEGAEFSMQYDAGSLSAWLTLSHSRVLDRIDGEWFRRSWDQRLLAGGGLSWRGDRWEASVAAGWHSGWPTTEVSLATLDPFPLASAGKRNASNLSDYARIDMRVARRFDLGSAGELTAYAEVSNLTDRANVCCVEYQLENAGQGVLLDVEPRPSLPLIPSLGVLWKF